MVLAVRFMLVVNDNTIKRRVTTIDKIQSELDDIIKLLEP